MFTCVLDCLGISMPFFLLSSVFLQVQGGDILLQLQRRETAAALFEPLLYRNSWRGRSRSIGGVQGAVQGTVPGAVCKALLKLGAVPSAGQCPECQGVPGTVQGVQVCRGC